MTTLLCSPVEIVLAVAATILLVVSSAHAASIDCDFTSGSLCGWMVDIQDQIQLQVMQEEQPPPELKTSGAFDSDYVFVTMGQMITKNRGKSKLRLLSPYFDTAIYDQFGGQTLPAIRCFSFWYRSASWTRSVAASFAFGLQSGSDFFSEEIHEENANVWRYKQIDLHLKRPTDKIRLSVDGGDTYFGYVAFDRFKLSSMSCDNTKHVIDRYSMRGGNCPGNYLAQFGEPIGCYKCTLAECMQTCEAFAFCRGVSWVDRKALNGAFPTNSQCYLKAKSCKEVLKYTGGYKFYERISGFSVVPPDNINATSVSHENRHGNHNFQVLSSIDTPLRAPGPEASAGELGKWLPRNAKENSEFENAWLRPFDLKQMALASSKMSTAIPVPTAGWAISSAAANTGGHYSTNPTMLPTFVTGFNLPMAEPSTTSTSTSTSTTTARIEASPSESPSPTPSGTSPYSLVPSPFPNSKHLYGYVPLQPFGNCGGHFIIDENHQYLGCTRCSFAQCATLCSLSEQCRGFSFTESILVAKQCYLKTALTCEPQPSSTGFKYFIKVKKANHDQQVAEASNGKNGIGAFTIKPVMPVQTPTSSEQESRERTVGPSEEPPTPLPWLSQQASLINKNNNLWSTNLRYVPLNGNCAGSFLRDGSGEAVKCPRCSLAACQKLCDQDDECRGISFTSDNSVSVQCFLKTIDNCVTVSTGSSYFFHAKKD